MPLRRHRDATGRFTWIQQRHDMVPAGLGIAG
jgi:hypothetical protein